MNEPLVAHLGDRVQATTAPMLVQHVTATGVFTVGVALDLAILGEAASSVFGVKLPSTAQKGN